MEGTVTMNDFKTKIDRLIEVELLYGCSRDDIVRNIKKWIFCELLLSNDITFNLLDLYSYVENHPLLEK